MNEYIFICKVKTNAPENKVILISQAELQVLVTTHPEKGKANHAIIALLSDYFKVGKYCITIISGITTRTKKIKIMTDKNILKIILG